VTSFCFCEEFLGVGFVVLAFFNANLASAVAGFAAVEAEATNIVFAGTGGDV
jgi:hypothetical protein